MSLGSSRRSLLEDNTKKYLDSIRGVVSNNGSCDEKKVYKEYEGYKKDLTINTYHDWVDDILNDGAYIKIKLADSSFMKIKIEDIIENKRTNFIVINTINNSMKISFELHNK